MDKIDKTPTELAVVEASTVQNLIYTVRGKQIMLDSDLAMLYDVETKRLNESMKRNKKRFPENFCFQLTEDEFANLRSQIATSNTDEGAGGRRYLPFAYTEQGISMLSAVLRSDQAIAVSIGIMNAFIEMRHFIASNALMFERIRAVELSQLEYKIDTDAKFDKIFTYISDHEESSQKLYFDGQIYDAFSLLASLISQAKKSIILIDGYVDTGTLDLLSKKTANIPVTIYTFKRGNKLTATEIQKFNTQYPTIDIKIDESFHDRFLILDDSTCYHIGASLKDAGKKSFALSLIADPKMVKDLLNRL
ncbi:MAG: ORF6N domain-containing protein [Lachnospiraceae bacterium]|nr:ORF6N domain-containing protein [Lachnospiraceae bacterium]